MSTISPSAVAATILALELASLAFGALFTLHPRIFPVFLSLMRPDAEPDAVRQSLMTMSLAGAAAAALLFGVALGVV